MLNMPPCCFIGFWRLRGYGKRCKNAENIYLDISCGQCGLPILAWINIRTDNRLDMVKTFVSAGHKKSCVRLSVVSKLMHYSRLLDAM